MEISTYGLVARRAAVLGCRRGPFLRAGIQRPGPIVAQTHAQASGLPVQWTLSPTSANSGVPGWALCHARNSAHRHARPITGSRSSLLDELYHDHLTGKIATLKTGHHLLTVGASGYHDSIWPSTVFQHCR